MPLRVHEKFKAGQEEFLIQKWYKRVNVILNDFLFKKIKIQKIRLC